MDNRPRIPTPDPDHPGELLSDGPVQTTAWRSGDAYVNMGGDDFKTETKGISGVEFDTKMSETYVSLAEYSRTEPKGHSDEPSKTSRCVVTLLCFFVFVSLIGLIAGLGGLGLALYNFLPPFFSNLNPQNASSIQPTASSNVATPSSTADLQAQLTTLQTTIDQISTMLERVRQNVEAANTTNTNNGARINQLDMRVENLSNMVEEIVGRPSMVPTASSQTTTTPAAVTTSTTGATTTTTTTGNRFQEIGLYQNCTTKRLAFCTIQTTLLGTIPTFSTCLTSDVPLNTTGMYNLDLYCAITEPGGEMNPLVATLDVDENRSRVRCFCYVIVNNAGSPRSSSPVECALYATRCPTNFYLNTTDF